MKFLFKDLTEVLSDIDASAGDFLHRLSEEEITPIHVEEVGVSVVAILMVALMAGPGLIVSVAKQSAALALAQQQELPADSSTLTPTVTPVETVSPSGDVTVPPVTPATIAPLPAGISTVTPKPASVISGTVNFEWNAVRGATEYRFSLGTSRGGIQLYGQSTNTNTTVSVSNIPETAKAFYARIGYKVANRWKYRDVIYKALKAPVTTITTVTPAAGSTLGASQTFTWNAVTNASEYVVRLGTVRGGKDIVMKSTGTNTTVTLEGIPQQGMPMYLRIYYKVGASWKYRDVGYKESLNDVSITDPHDPTSISLFSVSIKVSDADAVCIAAPCEVPVPGSKVTLRSTQSGSLVASLDASSGLALFEDLKAGSYAAEATASGYESASVSFDVVSSNASRSISLKKKVVQPTVSLLTNGGENLERGTMLPVSWNVPPFNNTPVSVYLVQGSLSHLLAENIADSPFNWTVGTVSGPASSVSDGQYALKVCIQGTSICDTSDALYTIWTPSSESLRLIFPNGGETLTTGRAYNFTWTAPVNVVATYADIKLVPQYAPCLSGGCNAYAIAAGIGMSRYSFEWVIPEYVDSGPYIVEICQSGTVRPVCDSSDATFSISR